MNRNTLPLKVSFYPQKLKVITLPLSLCRDRSETSVSIKDQTQEGVQRHKKTEGCWVGEGEAMERERPK